MTASKNANRPLSSMVDFAIASALDQAPGPKPTLQLTTEDAGILHQEASDLYDQGPHGGHASYAGYTIWPGDDQSTVRTSISRNGRQDQIAVMIRGHAEAP